MYNVLFVCHGNICRSPMAEFIFKDMIYSNNKRYKMSCASRATSYEEIGNGLYEDARRVLEKNKVNIERHKATRISKDDYDKYDFIIVMDSNNMKNIMDILGTDKDNKVHYLYEYNADIGEIEDPWYTGRFDYVYDLIYEGCKSLFEYIDNLGDKDEI